MTSATFKSALLATAFGICLFVSPAAHAADANTLYVYTWDTYADKDLFKQFETETGIKVVTDIYSSNDELLAKLKSGAAYDIVVPSGNYVPRLVSEKLLQPLPDESRKFADTMVKPMQHPAYDTDDTYVLPLFYGTTGLAVNTKLTKDKFDSWKDFFDRPEGSPKNLGVLDDVGTLMDVASLKIAKPYCEAEPATLKSIQAMLLAQKPFVKVYGSTGYTERMAANEVAVQMAWSGDAFKAREQNPAIKYVYPSEGVELWADNLAIPVSAGNVEAAKKFIAFVLRADVQSVYSDYTGMPPTQQAAADKLPEKLKNAPEYNIPASAKGIVSMACPPAVNKSYQKIWESVQK